MKSIGIIGSGMVGQALAKGFIAHGYSTSIASRSSETRDKLQNEFGDSVSVDIPENVAADNEIIVFAVKGTIAKEAIVDLGIESLQGKIIIDATNPISSNPPEDGVLHYFSSINRSLMEDLQDIVPKARFVKAFSCVGNALMVNPQLSSKPSMFICGNDETAKTEVKEILVKFGWEIEDMGTAPAARAIEPLAMLWCIPGFRENRWNHAFQMLKS